MLDEAQVRRADPREISLGDRADLAAAEPDPDSDALVAPPRVVSRAPQPVDLARGFAIPDELVAFEQNVELNRVQAFGFEVSPDFVPCFLEAGYRKQEEAVGRVARPSLRTA